MVCIYIPAIVVEVDAKLEVVEVNMRELEVAEVEKVSKRVVVVLIFVLEGKLVEVVEMLFVVVVEIRDVEVEVEIGEVNVSKVVVDLDAEVVVEVVVVKTEEVNIRAVDVLIIGKLEGDVVEVKTGAVKVDEVEVKVDVVKVDEVEVGGTVVELDT